MIEITNYIDKRPGKGVFLPQELQKLLPEFVHTAAQPLTHCGFFVP